MKKHKSTLKGGSGLPIPERTVKGKGQRGQKNRQTIGRKREKTRQTRVKEGKKRENNCKTKEVGKGVMLETNNNLVLAWESFEGGSFMAKIYRPLTLG
jgi:hypothetical protein